MFDSLCVFVRGIYRKRTPIYVMTLLLFVCAAQEAISSEPIKTDLMLLLDSSNSISSEEFWIVRTGLISSSSSFYPSICSCLQVGVLQYGQLDGRNLTYLSTNPRHYQSPTDLGDCKTVSCFDKAVNNMEHLRAANTYTARAIERVVKFNFHQSAVADSSKKILIIITDGGATDYKLLNNSFSLTQSNNVTVYTIGVGTKVNLGHLRMSANGGMSDERVATAGNFIQLASILKSIYNDVVPVCGNDNTTSSILCEVPTTFQTTTEEALTTGESPTTSEASTSSEPSTTIEPSTTGEPSTTSKPSTTSELSTTSDPTTTDEPSTTNEPSTTGEPSTTSKPSTTSEPPTTSEPQLCGETNEVWEYREAFKSWEGEFRKGQNCYQPCIP